MLGCLAVGGLARRQQEGERSALAIGDGVDPFDKLRTGLVSHPPRLTPIAWECAPLFRQRRSGAP